MKNCKYVYFISTIIIFMLGQVFKMGFQDSGIDSLQTYDDIYQLDAGIQYILGENEEDEKFKYSSFQEYKTSYVDEVKESDIIIIGTPTGVYGQYGISFYQQVVVDNVIKGENIKEDSIINVYGTDGFKCVEGNKVVYSNIKNIMFENNQYLIFLNRLELENANKNESYRLQGGYFCYLLLKDSFDYPLNQEVGTLKFNDMKDIEYFTGSERILQQIKEIKKTIISENIEQNLDKSNH